jgi:hypothetical protein
MGGVKNPTLGVIALTGGWAASTVADDRANIGPLFSSIACAIAAIAFK